MKYTIEVPEVHIATHEVVADSTDEALEKIKMGESIILAFEYSHSLEVKNIIKEGEVMPISKNHKSKKSHKAWKKSQNKNRFNELKITKKMRDRKANNPYLSEEK